MGVGHGSSGIEHNYLVSGWNAICPSGDSNPMDCANANDRNNSRPRTWTDVTYLLNKANVSWRYYVYEGLEPDCESDETAACVPLAQAPQTPGIWNPLPVFTDVKQDGQLGNIQSLTNFYGAVHDQSGCGLPNVSWIDPKYKVSEHPNAPVSEGQAYVTTLVNAIMRSPCWGSTAIFLSWDDWGGLYDHVAPPNIDENGYGLRVPGLVISPYAKTGYIDHQQLSHDAYLKFIEDDFLNEGRLDPATDGRPDARPDVREDAAGLGTLAEDFNFNQAPRPPLLLAAHPQPGPPSEPPGSNLPSVEMLAASSIAQTTATLQGTVKPKGGALSDCHFDYGTSTEYGASVPCSSLPEAGTSPVAVSAALSGLTPNRTYHARLVATNAGGTSISADESFTTPPDPPTVQTLAASSIAQTTATLQGTVNPKGGALSDCHFDYGTSTEYGASVPCSSLPEAGTSPVAVSAALSGLTPNRTYHARLVAMNAGGTSISADESFTTPPDPPTVQTGPASPVGQTTATLTASVNPNEGTVSDCHFDYGTSTAYGLSIPCASLPEPGASPVAVSAMLAGLTPNASYHARVVARNQGGTSEGADAVFTTSELLPEVGRCVRVPAEGAENRHHGRYANAACTLASEASTGEFEWAPGAAKRGLRLTGGASVLETAARFRLSCTAQSGRAELTGPRSATAHFTFTGCESASNVPCQSEGASAGEISDQRPAGKPGLHQPPPYRRETGHLGRPASRRHRRRNACRKLGMRRSAGHRGCARGCGDRRDRHRRSHVGNQHAAILCAGRQAEAAELRRRARRRAPDLGRRRHVRSGRADAEKLGLERRTARDQSHAVNPRRAF